MTIKVGDTLPSTTFRVMTADGPKPKTTDEMFKGKKVVLFAVPGAFTPTCTKNHLPGFVTNAAAIKAKGIDAIAVTAVNDPFVMGAWKKPRPAPTRSSSWPTAAPISPRRSASTLDASAGGLGIRSKRYCMVVDDGVVKSLTIEDAPGKADVSGADALLKSL